MSSSSPTTKKRKANDGRATASDDTNHDQINAGGSGTLSSWLGYYFSGRRGKSAPPPASCNDNLSQKMDRMEQIMLRMEEKCNSLEAKCNSLENILKEHVDSKINEAVDSLDAKIDQKFKQHEYNDMIQRNQSWEYSAPVHSRDELIDAGFEIQDASYIRHASEILREATEKMRSGEYPEDTRLLKGLNLDIGSGYGDRANNHLFPHWREFAAALKQFTPALDVLPDNCEAYFKMYHVELNDDTMLLLKDALMKKPFQALAFRNDEDRDFGVGGMSEDAIMDIMDSNKNLRSLDLRNYYVARDHIVKICSTVHNHSLVKLDLDFCFEHGLGDEMLTSLLTESGGLKLEELSLCHNGITSRAIRMLSEFLATDPPLKSLDLEENSLTNNDASLFANALRSNTSLAWLNLYGNRDITDEGGEALGIAVNDDSNLNSVSDSNHSCHVYLHDVADKSWDMNPEPEGSRNESTEYQKNNRARKIYMLLSSRNESLSNVQHFDGIDVKMLPNMIEAVQRYANSVPNYTTFYVKDLSIMYEVMRKWEKVFPLYELIERN